MLNFQGSNGQHIQLLTSNPPNVSETCKFLNPSEQELLIARLAADVADAKMNRLDGAAYKRVFSDWKVYLGVLMYFGVVNNGYAVSVSSLARKILFYD